MGDKDWQKEKINPGWTTEGLSDAKLGSAEAHDEDFHSIGPEANHAWTETSYWGFRVPEKKLVGEIYLWFHPVLKVMSAGVIIWKGIKRAPLECEYVNHHHFLPLPEQGILDYEVPQVGLRIRIEDPLHEARISMSDDERGVSFDIQYSSVHEPVSRPNGGHFVQVMKTKGTLHLYGERIDINNYFTRDRSWGDNRYETPRNLPPISWLTGTRDDDFSFHLVAFDDPNEDPEWKDEYDYPSSGENLLWGYIYDGGVYTAIKQVKKRTIREENDTPPIGFEMTIIDEKKIERVLKGDVIARVPWNTWANVVVNYSLTKWSMNDQEAWGDCQDIHYNRYVNMFSRNVRSNR